MLGLVGGAPVLVGPLTRPVTVVLPGPRAFAYFIAHAPEWFWPLANGGELANVFRFVFLYLSAAGGGPWSLDAPRARTTRAADARCAVTRPSERTRSQSPPDRSRVGWRRSIDHFSSAAAR